MNKLSSTLAACFASLVLLVGTGRAAENTIFDGPELALTRITENVYVIYGPLELPNKQNRGFRNNPVIVLTGQGVVILDPGGSAWAGEQVVAAVRSITADPVVAIFNSHAHGDHWLGNEGIRHAFPDVAIYAHPLMKDRVTGPDGQRWLEQIEHLTKGTSGGSMVIAPTHTVTDGDLIRIGDTHFRIYHTGAAHTDHDIMIEIVEEKSIFTGDVVRNGMLGLMESDSSFAGNISAIDTILAMNFEHYIPGHGPVGGKDAVNAYRSYLDTVLSQVRTLYAEGLTDYEMKPVVDNALSSFNSWAGYRMRLGPHVSRAFLEVEEENF